MAFDLSEIILRINKLSNKEKNHILKVLKSDNVDFTKNANGYFFDLGQLDSTYISNVKRCLDSIEQNRDQLDKMNKRREALLVYYKKIINEKIEQKNLKKYQLFMDKITVQALSSNITAQINKVRRFDKDRRDPDELIKEYTKDLNKAPKGSIFYKIEARMRAQRQKRNLDNPRGHRNQQDDCEPETDFHTFDSVPNALEHDGDYTEGFGDLDEDPAIGDADDINDMDGDTEGDDIDQDVDQDIDIDPDIDHDIVEMDDVVDDEYYSDSDTIQDTQDTQTQLEMEYYKKILNKQGFFFDDNKHCLLVYQDYIK
ncbi:MAG: hypothetical protein EBU90_02215 [Proteobacteria bacterium]|nr:hypothetical protein [Pseudomonadota bacterium]NBP13299.1 hypothetical protein [bacterium]